MTTDDVLLALNHRIGTTVDVIVRTITDEFALAGASGELLSEVGVTIETSGDARQPLVTRSRPGAAAIYFVGDAWFTVRWPATSPRTPSA